MSTSPLLPCKDPPLLQRLTLRASSSQQHSMDEDPRPRVHHGGDRGYGGPAVPPRIVGTTTDSLATVHRPSPTPPVPARPDWRMSPSRPPPPQEREVITLAGPLGPRASNEYVENPARMVRPINNINPPNSDHPESRGLLPHERILSNRSPAIRTQPKSSSTGVLKDHNNKKGQTIPASDPTPGHMGHIEEEPHDSIICKRCGKCKCNDCTSPRELPSRWICEERYECSANKVVEYCSCLQCVKCVFYHCENSEDNMSTADVPCACFERQHCCIRWTCMGLMCPCLPCLCLYWPLRAVVKLTTACYNGCSRRGCQCHREKSSGQTLTKRPLIDSESSSA